MSQEIEQQISDMVTGLRAYRRTHIDLGLRLFKKGRTVHMLDLLAFGSLNRSLQLTYAFCSLIEHTQSFAAAPLVRLQLDNALRFSAIYLVEKPQEFAWDVFKGTSIRDLVSKTGRKLTDTYLVQELAKDHTWVKPVYQNTSGFIHLSERHIFSALQATDDPDVFPGGFQGYISERDVFIPPSFRCELLDAFKAATDLFLEQVIRWADIKDALPISHEPQTPDST